MVTFDYIIVMSVSIFIEIFIVSDIGSWNIDSEGENDERSNLTCTISGGQSRMQDGVRVPEIPREPLHRVRRRAYGLHH